MSTLPSAAQKQLLQLVEQIERLEQDKKALADDIRDKYLEAKAVGFDVKAIRKIVSLRKKSKTEREEEESILDVYLHALGMLAGTPLGDYATERDFGDGQTDIEDSIDETVSMDLLKGTTVSLNGGPEIPIEKATQQLTEHFEKAFAKA